MNQSYDSSSSNEIQPEVQEVWNLPTGAVDIVKNIAAERILEIMLSDRIPETKDSEQSLSSALTQSEAEALEDLVTQYPVICQRKYKIHGKEGSSSYAYPLGILLKLRPRLQTIQTVLKLYPAALQEGNLLLLACKHNANLDIVQFLHSQRPTLIQTPMKHLNVFPLHWACRRSKNLAHDHNDSSSIIDFLLQVYPNAAQEADAKSQCLPLHVAVAYGVTLPVLQRIYEAYPPAVMQRDTNGWVPLHHACHFPRNLEVVQWLVESMMTTPEDDEDVELLLQEALHHAAAHQTRNVLEFLLGKSTIDNNQDEEEGEDDEPSLLSRAVVNNTLSVVDLIVTKFPWMVNRSTRFDGRLPLHDACRYKASLGTIQILVTQDPSTLLCRDAKGQTPLDIAYLHYKNFRRTKSYTSTTTRNSDKNHVDDDNTNAALVLDFLEQESEQAHDKFLAVL